MNPLHNYLYSPTGCASCTRVAKPGFPLDLVGTVQTGVMTQLPTSSISHATAADAYRIHV